MLFCSRRYVSALSQRLSAFQQRISRALSPASRTNNADDTTQLVIANKSVVDVKPTPEMREPAKEPPKESPTNAVLQGHNSAGIIASPKVGGGLSAAWRQRVYGNTGPNQVSHIPDTHVSTFDTRVTTFDTATTTVLTTTRRTAPASCEPVRRPCRPMLGTVSPSPRAFTMDFTTHTTKSQRPSSYRTVDRSTSLQTDTVADSEPSWRRNMLV